MIEIIKATGENLSYYTPEQLYETVEMSRVLEKAYNEDELAYIYLKNISGKGIKKRKRERITKSLLRLMKETENLKTCFKQEYIDILGSCYYSETSLVDTDIKTLDFLAENENARKFLYFLHSRGIIYREIDSETLNAVSQNFDLVIADLKKIYSSIGYIDFSRFMEYWSESNFSVRGVRVLVKRLNDAGYNPTAFISKVNYVNFIGGNVFEAFDFEDLHYKSKDIIVYAILNNKKGFLNLVKNNLEEFRQIPVDSVIFDECVYKTLLNLNALNLKNLQALCKMKSKEFVEENFDAHSYTFDEFKVLYKEDEQYGILYRLLKIERVDEKLTVIRELCKRHILPANLSKDSYEFIADKLSVKPLSRWYKEEYSDISDLTLADVVSIFANFELIEKFRSEIKSRKDVKCIIRNRDYAANSDRFEDLINNILENDSSWLELKEVMNLSDEFIGNNKVTVSEFVLNGNAEIANSYYPCLEGKYKDAFFTVVKAEMLGKLKELKYYPGDLEKEIDFPVTKIQEEIWAQNSSMELDGIYFEECDGFAETMTMGVKPTRTCMSYNDGQYRECLISNFDSNKKILYAYINGACVARAIMRLTKGSYSKSECKSEYKNNISEMKFAEISENGTLKAADSSMENEHICVFLERMYFAYVNENINLNIQKQFLDYARRKAETLDAECIISTDYSKVVKDMPYTAYRMYISRSKAGNQYLDSLGGSASVSNERTMKNITIFTAGRKENE